MRERATMEHLFSCFDAAYRVLGEAAPTLQRDAFVIRTYEAGRALGAVALDFREYLGEVSVAPFSPLESTLRDALAGDDSGALILYALAVVVGPRLLVSLRDARDQVDLDEEALEVLSGASRVLIEEILKVGEVAEEQTPLESAVAQERVRDLSDRLDSSGNADSFGVSR